MPKTQRLSDAALVRRSQQGDRRSFGALVARYDRRLRGLAFALLLDRGQMDAALGLAYMRSWRDVLRIRPRDDIGPWLYRAVYNACIDQLRRNEAPSENQQAPAEVPPGAPGGLRAVLGTLAPADRVAVVLVEREGFSVTSAARILGVTTDELETRLDVVRDRLAPYVPAPTAPPEADEGATEAPAPETAGDEEPTPAAAASGNGAEGLDGPPADGRADDGPPAEDGPPADEDLPAEEDQAEETEESVPVQTTAKGNGQANRGRGRRARRRANGADRLANGAPTPAAAPAEGTDDTEPANGETASDAGDPPVGDGSDQPTAAPSTGEHQAAER
jgi:RNA polymerase sigma-70 factor (ECF subfamily)